MVASLSPDTKIIGRPVTKWAAHNLLFLTFPLRFDCNHPKQEQNIQEKANSKQCTFSKEYFAETNDMYLVEKLIVAESMLSASVISLPQSQLAISEFNVSISAILYCQILRVYDRLELCF